MSRHSIGGSGDGKKYNTPSKGNALEVKKRRVGCLKEIEKVTSMMGNGSEDWAREVVGETSPKS